MSENQWYLLDHDENDKLIAGPYEKPEGAGAARIVLERQHHHYRSEGNLIVVSSATLARINAQREAP